MLPLASPVQTMEVPSGSVAHGLAMRRTLFVVTVWCKISNVLVIRNVVSVFAIKRQAPVLAVFLRADLVD